jgi:hypothetical protein
VIVFTQNTTPQDTREPNRVPAGSNSRSLEILV